MYSGEDVRQRQLPSGAQRAPDEHTLYVKCVSKSMKAEGVRNLFSPYGEVVNCKILENDGRFPTNRALVGMSSTDACNAAISGLDGRKVGKRQKKLYVEFKKPRCTQNNVPQEAQSSNGGLRGYHQDRRSGYYSGGLGGHSGMYNTDNSGAQLVMGTYYQGMPCYSLVNPQSPLTYEHGLYSGENVRQQQQSLYAQYWQGVIGNTLGTHWARSGLYNNAQHEMGTYYQGMPGGLMHKKAAFKIQSQLRLQQSSRTQNV